MHVEPILGEATRPGAVPVDEGAGALRGKVEGGGGAHSVLPPPKTHALKHADSCSMIEKKLACVLMTLLYCLSTPTEDLKKKYQKSLNCTLYTVYCTLYTVLWEPLKACCGYEIIFFCLFTQTKDIQKM